jgi:hypothetical protein
MKEEETIPLKAIYCERIGFQIAFVNTDKKSVDLQAQANARLISAAPCLLEALQNLEAAFQSHTQWNGEPLNEVKAARAAIAAATKEQP